MTKSGRPTDYDYAMNTNTFGVGRKVEDPRVMAERVKRDMMRRAGVLDQYLSGLPDATDSAGEPIPMGEEDRRVARVAEERARDEAPPKPRGDPNPRPDYAAAVTAILDEQGRNSDDPDFQQLLDYRYTSEEMALEKIRALGPKEGAKPMPTQRLDEATAEWETLHKSPGVGSPQEAERRARRKELEAVIKGLEALGE